VIGILITTNYTYTVTTNIEDYVTNVVTEAHMTGTTTNGAFGTQATFGFTARENSRVNPFRHAFHPSHDGYTWDFTTPTPSGDDFRNYVATVKPETFSVINRITFIWDPSTGSRWTPAETLTGSLVWEFDGIRHEGTIRASGTFTMKRISAADLDR